MTLMRGMPSSALVTDEVAGEDVETLEAHIGAMRR